MERKTFITFARVISVLAAVSFFILIWIGNWVAGVVFLVTSILVIMVLGKKLEEPLIDERENMIQMLAFKRTSQAFAFLMLLAIIWLGCTGENKALLGGLEASLGIFLLLKLVFTKYYEGRI